MSTRVKPAQQETGSFGPRLSNLEQEMAEVRDELQKFGQGFASFKTEVLQVLARQDAKPQFDFTQTVSVVKDLAALAVIVCGVVVYIASNHSAPELRLQKYISDTNAARIAILEKLNK